MGYYTNILPRLGITKVQIRLITKELLEVFEKHDTYINYGIEELEEDIAHAKSGERF